MKKKKRRIRKETEEKPINKKKKRKKKKEVILNTLPKMPKLKIKKKVDIWENLEKDMLNCVICSVMRKSKHCLNQCHHGIIHIADQCSKEEYCKLHRSRKLLKVKCRKINKKEKTKISGLIKGLKAEYGLLVNVCRTEDELGKLLLYMIRYDLTASDIRHFAMRFHRLPGEKEAENFKEGLTVRDLI